MLSVKNDALSLVRELRTLLEGWKEPVFAEAEDADFFRQQHRKTKGSGGEKLAKQVVPPVAIIRPEPPPVEKAAPKVEVREEAPIVPTPPPILKEPPRNLAPVQVKEPAQALPNGSLKALLSKIAPELAVIEQVPSDELAKKIATRWKTKNQVAPITLLAFQETEEQRKLLEAIAKALDVVFGSARLVEAANVEREAQWDTLLSASELKLVVICDSTLWQLPNLRDFYREIPTSGKRMMKEKPLFLLPDLSLYLKDSLLKRSLWKALCHSLQSSSTTT